MIVSKKCGENTDESLFFPVKTVFLVFLSERKPVAGIVRSVREYKSRKKQNLDMYLDKYCHP